jgi:hypothetical protein
MLDKKTSEGSCMCGAVRFAVDLPTKWCAHCHCGDCRRAHGAAYVTWFGVESTAFRISAGEAVVTNHPSSPGVVRTFCSRCGTTMFYRGERWPTEVHVALACMHEPIDRAPAANVYWDLRVAWGVTDGLRRLGGPTGLTPLD